MYKRLELHNHTNESDAVFTCRELTEFMVADKVDAFALTDHNTISGNDKVRQIIRENNLPIAFIPGMEYTTYYGHILCLNLEEYVPWENINRHKPELLFEAARQKGALVGIAHPYSFGWPFAQGCRFVMKVTDYSCVDFIEIFNNPEPLHAVNEKAVRLWTELVLSGHRLAATCGMDLHGSMPLAGHYATYIEGAPEGDICRELQSAIRAQRTWICKGPLLEVHTTADAVTFSLHQTQKPGYAPLAPRDYVVTLTSQKNVITCGLNDRIERAAFDPGAAVIPMLYERRPIIENLVCVSPPLHLA